MKTNSTVKSMVACAAILLQLSACMGQAGKQKNTTTKSDTLAVDTPKVDVKVNKQYDENGNLIAFDSTYIKIYPGRAGNLAFLDSIFKDFKGRSGNWYPFLNDPGFNDLFMNDSIMQPDFFHDDFFRKRFDLNRRYMEQMMARMDSVKNAFLQQEAERKTH
ncbi:MAG: hypothetical protein WAT61_11160 [Flavobacteriales bacterium]